MPLYIAHKTVFIHIPKTGGSSVHAIFSGHGDPAVFYSGRWLLNNHSPQHSTFRELERWGMLPEGWRIFTIVRNPYDRFVSEYNSRPNVGTPLEFAQKLFDPILAQAWDNHHKPASTFMEGSTGQVDVLRFEDLAAGFKRLTGLEFDRHANASPKKITQLPDDVKAIVAREWADDFKNFNYQI